MRTGELLVQAAASRALPVRKPPARLEPVHRTHPWRASFEHFIVARFQRAYGANVTQFLPNLLGVHDALAGWRAALGYAAAHCEPLFLEQYLDRPIEQALAARLGRPVARNGVVEVGNLAAVSTGMTRALIPLLARHLHRLGYRWVVFTATRTLRNSFHRLGLQPLSLAPADPARLRDAGASWGTYYEQKPQVMAARISHGLRAGEHP